MRSIIREFRILSPWVLPVMWAAFLLSQLGCDDWMAMNEPPAHAYRLTNADPVARAILSWYGETDLTHSPIYGVPVDLERCNDQTFWHPGMRECLYGVRHRDGSGIYLAVSANRSTYGHSFLCHELAHEVLDRDGDSDHHHKAVTVWQDRSGPESMEYGCWNWVLASPGLNLVIQ